MPFSYALLSNNLSYREQVIGSQMLEASNIPCKAVVFFSSTSSVWSQSGSSHYASANAVLDTAATSRQYVGKPGLAVQYGPFSETGMASKHVAALISVGLHPLKPREVSLSSSLVYNVPCGWQLDIH